jgi:hypothetical protein
MELKRGNILCHVNFGIQLDILCIFEKLLGLGNFLSSSSLLSFHFDKNLPNINKTKHPERGKRKVKDGRIQV